MEREKKAMKKYPSCERCTRNCDTCGKHSDSNKKKRFDRQLAYASEVIKQIARGVRYPEVEERAARLIVKVKGYKVVGAGRVVPA